MTIAENRPYRILLALSQTTHIEDWIKLAQRLLPEVGEIRLRGLITVAPDKSLSEGTLPARQLRDAFDQITKTHPEIYDATEIRVSYNPLENVIHELQTFQVDLLLAEWAGIQTTGYDLQQILHHTPCDVVLLPDAFWHDPGAVLLSLRGGPNLTLGMRVAKALSAGAGITLFHAADKPQDVPDLHSLMEPDLDITRIVTAVGKITENITREATGHKIVVLGAGLHYLQNQGESVLGAIGRKIELPIAVVRAWHPEEITFHPPRLFTHHEEDLSTRVDRWFAENNFHSYEFNDLPALLALKKQQGVKISVGLPALNEAATIGQVITVLKNALMDEIPLVDEIVLIDSNSTDDTVEIALSHGIPVYRHPEILPEAGTYHGKGEALWKSLCVMQGDILVWVDTDIANIHPRFIYGLVGPLLKRPNLQYVKSYFHRPLKTGDTFQAASGGRVTEILARPLLNLFYPELSGVIQPLSGQYAGRRGALEQMPFFTGYGVEVGLLMDMHDQFGLSAIAQVDLEELIHHNQPLTGLTKMSFAILQAFISRFEKRHNMSLLDHANRHIKLVTQVADRFALDVVEIVDPERPPITTFPNYQMRNN